MTELAQILFACAGTMYALAGCFYVASKSQWLATIHFLTAILMFVISAVIGSQ